MQVHRLIRISLKIPAIHRTGWRTATLGDFSLSELLYLSFFFCKNFTQVFLKVMPPIYFHGNCNIHKEHNNTVWQSIFSATELYFSTVLSLAMYFCQLLTRACMLHLQKFAPVEMTHCFTAATNSIIAKKRLLTQSIFHWLKYVEIKRCQIQTIQ